MNVAALFIWMETTKKMEYLCKHIKRAAMIMFLFTYIYSHSSSAQNASGVADIEFNQSIGLINIPTANLLKHGQLRMSLNAGIFSLGLFNYFEMGILAFNSNNKFYWGNRLEAKLIDEEGYIPALAVGAESATENPHLMDAPYINSSYVVASKGIGMFGTAHIGVGNGRFMGSGEASSKLNGLFCGIEKTFFEDGSNPLTVKLEEDGRDVNFGIIIRLLPGFYMTLTAAKLDNVIYNHPAPDNQAEYFLGFNAEGVLTPLKPGEKKP